jgi:hypothetical protein
LLIEVRIAWQQEVFVLLAQIIEVFQDIVLPWQREFKEKGELLREDPFVGFVATSVLGAAFYYFTRQSPSWLGFFLNYAGIAMFILGGFAALAAGWFGWRWYVRIAWPTVFLAWIIYGCFDTYLVVETVEKQAAKKYSRAEEVYTTIEQTDEIKRFTGRPLQRSVQSTDYVAQRPIAQFTETGLLNAEGKKHGRWEIFSEVPKRIAPTVKWYWNGEEVSEQQWEERAKAG